MSLQRCCAYSHSVPPNCLEFARDTGNACTGWRRAKTAARGSRCRRIAALRFRPRVSSRARSGVESVKSSHRLSNRIGRHQLVGFFLQRSRRVPRIAGAQAARRIRDPCCRPMEFAVVEGRSRTSLPHRRESLPGDAGLAARDWPRSWFDAQGAGIDVDHPQRAVRRIFSSTGSSIGIASRIFARSWEKALRSHMAAGEGACAPRGGSRISAPGHFFGREHVVGNGGGDIGLGPRA